MHIKIAESSHWLTVRDNFLGCKVVKKCSALSSSKRHPWKHPYGAGLDKQCLGKSNKSDCKFQVRHHGGACIKGMSRISVDEKEWGRWKLKKR